MSLIVPRELLESLCELGDDAIHRMGSYLAEKHNEQRFIDEARALLAKPAQDGWIPVTERLPKPNKQVLVNSKEYRVMFAIHKNRPVHPWEYLDGDTCREKITHWMNLPAAPEVKP